MTHPRLEALLQCPEDAPAAAEALAHLESGCPHCSRRLELAQRVQSALEAPPLPAAPEPWIRRAAALSRDASGGPLAGWRELIGQLVTPSPSGTLALRGGGLASTHLLFRAGAYDVDIAHLSDDGLVGQVIPSDGEENALAGGTCIIASTGMPRAAPIGAQGEFRFKDIPAGRYAIMLEGGGRVEGKEMAVILSEVDLTSETGTPQG